MILCSLNGLQTIATVETMNFRILCFIKILQPLLGWQNLDRTIAYTRFHRRKVGGGVGTLGGRPLQYQEGRGSWVDFSSVYFRAQGQEKLTKPSEVFQMLARTVFRLDTNKTNIKLDKIFIL